MHNGLGILQTKPAALSNTIYSIGPLMGPFAIFSLALLKCHADSWINSHVSHVSGQVDKPLMKRMCLGSHNKYKQMRSNSWLILVFLVCLFAKFITRKTCKNIAIIALVSSKIYMKINNSEMKMPVHKTTLICDISIRITNLIYCLIKYIMIAQIA